MRWIISARQTPRLARHCPGCRRTQIFDCADRFRVNANGRRLDAWLLYRCQSCERSLKVPVLERVRVDRIDPALLARLHGNCPDTARRLALAIRDHLEVDVAVARVDDGEPAIRVELADPIKLRLDRLLASELGLSRRQLRARVESGALIIDPWPRRGLAARVTSGTVITVPRL